MFTMQGFMARNRGKAAGGALAVLLALLATLPFALGQGGQPPTPLEIPGVSLKQAEAVVLSCLSRTENSPVSVLTKQ